MWLSPPDPWKNHNLYCESQHKGTTTWWTHGETFSKWKYSGSSSLLWLHGKRYVFKFRSGRFAQTHIYYPIAGAGKSVLSYVDLSILSAWKITFCRLPAPQSSRISATCAHQDWLSLRSFIATSGRTKKDTVVVYSHLSWSSFVINPTAFQRSFPNSIWRAVMAPSMPVTVN